MGIANCDMSAKTEISSMEPEISIAQLMESPKLSAYKLIASRLLPVKKEFLSSFYNSSSPHIKNYDPYYDTLSGAILTSSISNQGSNSPDLKNLKSLNHKYGSQTKKKKLKIKVKSSEPNEIPTTLTSLISLTAPKNKSGTRNRKHFLKQNITQSERTNKSYKHFDIISLLPPNVITLIFSFVADNYHSCLFVTASWYLSLLDSLDVMFNKIETKFAKNYIPYVVFRNSYTNFLKQDTSAVKIVRVLQFELLNPLENKTLTVGYTYKYTNDHTSRYASTYKIDCKSKGKNIQWIHKVINEYGKSVLTYGQNIIPVCTGDIFEIAINYYTLRGLIDIDTVECIKAVVEMTPLCSGLSKLAKSYNSFVVSQSDAMKQRICELEQLKGEEWYKLTESCIIEPDMEELLNCFILEDKECSHIDNKMQKLRLRATKSGILL